MKVGNTQLQFAEAIQFIRAKSPVTKEEFEALSAAARAKAFTVSGYTAAEVLEWFLQELEAAVADGSTFTEFLSRMHTFLERAGYDGVNPWKAGNIFRTNILTAYNAGHYKRMTSPALMAARPYWKYLTAGDSKVRETHAQMEGRIYRADDPIWDTWYPPNGFKCRCTVVSMTEEQVRRSGEQVYDSPPLEVDTTGELKKAVPDAGFRTNPAKEVWEPDTSGLSGGVKKAFEAYRQKETL